MDFTAKSERGKHSPDEPNGFISRREPFGYHPEMGRYPDLYNHLFGRKSPQPIAPEKKGSAHMKTPLASLAFVAGLVTGCVSPASGIKSDPVTALRQLDQERIQAQIGADIAIAGNRGGTIPNNIRTECRRAGCGEQYKKGKGDEREKTLDE